MKRLVIVLLIVFLCGMICANVVTKGLAQEGVLLDEEFYKEYAVDKLVFETIFWQILIQRCKGLIRIIVLSLTPLKKWMPPILCIGATFVMGFFLMCNTMAMAGVGFLSAIATFIPMVGCYGGMGILLYRGQEHNIRNKVQKVGVKTLSIMVATLLFVLGCVLESLVSVHLIPWMIRLSMI